MASAPPIAATIAATVRDPDWLPHRYDPGHDAVQFVHADRAARRRAPFLTDAELKLGAPRVVARAEAVATAAPAPVHFIFHAAFCCSTLLARAFDAPGLASSFKEPMILQDLVGWRHRGGEPARVGLALDGALALLARPFEASEACVIKPSNVVNGLASAMLSLRPQAAAVLMYAPLPVFLASIARKGMEGRLWARDLVGKQLLEGTTAGLGFEDRDHLLHTDLQAAAVGWLAQRKLFAELAARWPARVRLLDSEEFVARPREALAAAAALFGIAADDNTLDRIAASEAFTRDAKGGDRAFAPGQREAERAAGAAVHADEIDKVAVWAEAVAQAAGVTLARGPALLD